NVRPIGWAFFNYQGMRTGDLIRELPKAIPIQSEVERVPEKQGFLGSRQPVQIWLAAPSP
ncbi:MAG: hypothetical protein J6B70_02670, partial [Oscillospiraceae bacterium]|nr:hypothetical protein [Oscillospiraceae bacterium]